MENNKNKVCNNCGNENANTPVPYFVHQGALARLDRSNKRLWIVVLVLIFSLIGTNLAWIIYNSQFEVVETWEQDVVQDAEGGDNSFVGGDYYGEAED